MEHQVLTPSVTVSGYIDLCGFKCTFVILWTATLATAYSDPTPALGLKR
nr:hypothetical protein [Candidatus Freyarchaeota archaeon]